MTSEQILEISEPPEHQCPKIDAAIVNVEKSVDHVKNAGTYLRREYYDDAASSLIDAEYYAADIQDHFEECRTALDGVRNWGQEWKDLAKNLLDTYEPNWRDKND